MAREKGRCHCQEKLNVYIEPNLNLKVGVPAQTISGVWLENGRERPRERLGDFIHLDHGEDLEVFVLQEAGNR